MKYSKEKVGRLLSFPTSVESGAINHTYQRSSVAYENQCDRFKLEKRVFTRQYAHIYSVRLQKMRRSLMGRVREKWGSDVQMARLHELCNTSGSTVIIGTLFKNMELQPSILKEISGEHNLPLQPSVSCFSSDNDRLILEDESQRIFLVGNINTHEFVTGIVIAVCGEALAGDKFHVDGYCFAELQDYTHVNIPKEISNRDRYVVILSGLNFGNNAGSLFNIQLFIDSITGLLGDECEQECMARVVRVIIAGNSLSKQTQDRDSTSKAKYLTKDTRAGSVEAMNSLDCMLEQLASNVRIDILPGEFDPANHLLPQQPFHQCMFPKSYKYSTLNAVTNPYESVIDNKRFLGCSGQNIDDIRRFSRLNDPLDILEKTLRWGHMTPTSPDTLNAYPYSDEDPMIIRPAPHVYFVGNQPKFQTKLYKGSSGEVVRLVSVPAYSATSTCAIINLDTLDCHAFVTRVEGF